MPKELGRDLYRICGHLKTWAMDYDAVTFMPVKKETLLERTLRTGMVRAIGKLASPEPNPYSAETILPSASLHSYAID